MSALLSVPGCNQCGDGFNAPPTCRRSEYEVQACRTRVEALRRRCLIAYLASSPDAAQQHFDLMLQKRRDPERIARLRAAVAAEQARGWRGSPAQPGLAL